MKVAGIIAEYDPFHNGHLYHLKETKKRLSADFTVVVMSGPFVQRGMPARFDKFVRAAMAVENGADVVIELPYIYACNSGSEFAKGGIGILERLCCVTDLSFGSETGDIGLLEQSARALMNGGSPVQSEDAEPAGRMSAAVRRGLAAGMPYGSALTAAVAEVYGADAVAPLNRPNGLLAVEYMKRLAEVGSGIEPLAVLRAGAGHGEVTGARAWEMLNASGSAIRAALSENGGDPESVRQYVPEASFGLMQKAEQTDDDRPLYELLRYRLLTATANELAGIYSVTEGLENRMKSAVLTAGSYDDLAHLIKSRRYTLARIRRMLMHVLVNLKDSERRECRDTYYARILGFSKGGQDLLRHMRKTSLLPLVSNLSRTGNYDEDVRRSLQIDAKALDIYDLISARENMPGRDRRSVPYRGGR